MKKKNERRRPSRKPAPVSALALASGSPIQAIRFNINEYFRVKLTPRGKAIHRAEHDALNARFPSANLEYHEPEEDSDGWSKWQAWSLMQTFGPHISMGFDPPFETTIEVLVNIQGQPRPTESL